MTHSAERQALQARGRGSRAQLTSCWLSHSRQSGTYVVSGAVVDMTVRREGPCTAARPHGRGPRGAT
jgi:hypothetical protein